MERSNTQLLRNLSAAVNGQAATATFACGGSVEGRVTLRWDVDDQLQQHKITFPLAKTETTLQQTLTELVQRCQPATFGLGDRDVLDEKYRKAGKLDNTAFSTDFHPHDFGIVDAVQQILMPSTLAKAGEANVDSYGVRAELYKLNIYSAPSGKFLSHVDTPRGHTQFGSLVVCLPCAHEGGTLRVRHRSQTVDFLWGSDDPQAIQWAAFYGDCEHEVLEVTRGHRMTLTYNLYYAPLNTLARPVAEPTKLPLYSTVQVMLREDSFMRRGGTIGFFCHHAYAHSTESARKLLPGGLKGVDLAVFSVFQAQGLKTDVQPILRKQNSLDWSHGISNKWGGLSIKGLMREPDGNENEEGDLVETRLDSINGRGETEGMEGYDSATEVEEMEGYESDSRMWKMKEALLEDASIVGTQLHGPKSNASMDEALEQKGVIDEWPHEKILQILWMNEPQHQDFACAGLAYGNEAALDCKFSAAAILVRVPNIGARRVAKLAETGTKNPFAQID
ncbi:MAG: hypothetical protein Q9220_002650 [cf. Caloplaca sp. 1 TL-2023]